MYIFVMIDAGLTPTKYAILDIVTSCTIYRIGIFDYGVGTRFF